MTKKILIALDLNNTIFNYREKFAGVAWFSSPSFWQTLFSKLIIKANAIGIEIAFGIVSIENKHTKYYEEFCKEFENFKRGRTCQFHHVTIQDEMISLYKINDLKPTAIMQLANALDIPVEQCIMIDSKLAVLDNAAKLGIHPIPLTCFNPFMVDATLLKSEEYIDHCLQNFNMNLTAKVTQISEKIVAVDIIHISQLLKLLTDQIATLTYDVTLQPQIDQPTQITKFLSFSLPPFSNERTLGSSNSLSCLPLTDESEKKERSQLHHSI